MIRKATIADIKPIHKLLLEYGNQGQLLSRPLSELYDHVRDFSVFIDKIDKEDQEEEMLAGCCALQFCWEDLAEIRSLAVVSGFWKKKIGTTLVEEAISEAKAFDIRKLFTLTYQPDFFKQFGFTLIDRSELPLKIWKECITCVKFPNCDETAMIKTLTP
jgi:amino-acid N-acetyltransferase